MSLEHWWNNPDWEKLKYSEKSLASWPLCPQNSYMEWPGIETGPVQ